MRMNTSRWAKPASWARAGMSSFGAWYMLKGVAKPRLFSVGDYYAMAEAGIITHDERVELINGEMY